MNMQRPNAFERVWALGYHRLCPIVPPGAPLSERSSLFKRMRTNPTADARGKTPGVRWPDGTWSGFDFVRHESTEDDVARWNEMGAGVGIKTGQGVVLIDADTVHEDRAAIIKTQIEQHIGALPVRIGRYPKAGYLLRTDADFQYCRIEFGERDPKGRLLERVEILSEGRQFVADGIHPNTLQPYRWPTGLPPYAELPYVPGATLHALLEALRPLLPAAGELVREGASGEYDQAAFRGDPAAVERAVRALPNTTELFPTRDHYRDVGYAIKAALPDDERLAFELFTDWASRWEEGASLDDDGHPTPGNDPDVVAADWGRMKPPFRRGASWLFDLATQHSAGSFNRAEIWLDAPGANEPLFPEAPQNAFGDSPRIEATPYAFPEPSQIPPRQWLYDDHYIRKFVSATVAPSGVGKSSLKIAEALVMASGKPLLGVQPKGVFRVWLWNGEDPMDEMTRRIAAAMQHYGLTREDIGDRLFVDSGRDTEIVMATETRDGCKIVEPVASAVLATIAANRIDVGILDPFISTHRVTENDNGAIDMVTKRWARVADTGNCSIELVHHVRKLNGGEITVEDGRGAVSLLATSRSARALARMSKADATRMGLSDVRHRLFHIADGKNNLAPPAVSEGGVWFELVGVPLRNGLAEAGGGTDGVAAVMSGDSVGVVRRFVVDPHTQAVASDEKESTLALIKAGDWRRDPRAGDAWIGVPIAQGLGLDLFNEEEKGRVKSVVAEWIKAGTLQEVTRNDAQRRPRTFVIVAENSGVQNENSGQNVFE